MRFAARLRRRPWLLRGRVRAGLVGLSGVVLCVALGGCGGGATDDLPRQAVSGKVTLDGKPLARGSIQFQPVAGQGVAAGGEVKDGAYSVAREQGPVPGDYQVIISSTPPPSVEPTGPPGESTPPPPDPIPARYNTASTLTAKVEAGKASSLDFALTTK